MFICSLVHMLSWLYAYILTCSYACWFTCYHVHMLTFSHVMCAASMYVWYSRHMSNIPSTHVHHTPTSIKLPPAFAELWFGSLSKCRYGLGVEETGLSYCPQSNKPWRLKLVWTLSMTSTWLHVFTFILLFIQTMIYTLWWAWTQ